jgi:hypothetical protein
MSIEEELAELSTAYHGQRERMLDLEQLIKDYDAFIADFAPYTYTRGRGMRTLRERAKALGVSRGIAIEGGA